ncbi:MAG TPA: beta galactosidase jelly roll domain-containing protein [Cyclobacteriaceae bacterium]
MKISHSLLLALLLHSYCSFSQVVNLRGSWKFHVGDQSTWAAPAFNDSKWEYIHAPSTWEDEGFNGYDGFAWYRKKFEGRTLDKNESYTLALGFIDDCDEVFLNGKLIGFSGSMPPKFKTAYNNERKYVIPAEVINFNGENTIAIRVFDAMHSGGIVDGDLGIFTWQSDNKLLIDLKGVWSFALSEDDKPVKEESEWENLMVPGPWEHQGYAHYDGFAWYKRTFTIPAKLTTSDLVLMLGKIDDFDKVYLNGVLIGNTNDHRQFGSSGSYEKERVYRIPEVVLKKNAPNTIEVLVEDMGNIGGIYEGDIGITTRTNYEKYFR